MSSSSDDEQLQDEGRSKEQQKKHKIKRPMNAFMLWSKEKRRKISNVDPGLHNSHISKILGEEWKRLSVQEKEPYINQSKLLMDAHKREHPDYHYKPRQNKLAKALKELGSLQSSYTTSPVFASRIKSLSSTFSPHALRYSPYHVNRSRMLLSSAGELYHMPFNPALSYYPHPQSPPCSCTCSLECSSNRVLPSYHRHGEHMPLNGLSNTRYSPPNFVESSIPRHGVWRVSGIPPARYGWSVPSLVDDGQGRLSTNDHKEGKERSCEEEEHKLEGDNNAEKMSIVDT